MKHIILIILLTLGIWAEEVGVPYVDTKNIQVLSEIRGLYVKTNNLLVAYRNQDGYIIKNLTKNKILLHIKPSVDAHNCVVDSKLSQVVCVSGDADRDGKESVDLYSIRQPSLINRLKSKYSIRQMIFSEDNSNLYIYSMGDFSSFRIKSNISLYDLFKKKIIKQVEVVGDGDVQLDGSKILVRDGIKYDDLVTNPLHTLVDKITFKIDRTFELSGILGLSQDGKTILRKDQKNDLYRVDFDHNSTIKLCHVDAKYFKLKEFKPNRYLFYSFYNGSNLYELVCEANRTSSKRLVTNLVRDGLSFDNLVFNKDKTHLIYNNAMINTNTAQKELMIYPLDAENWIIITPDGYFDGSPESRKYLTMKTPWGESVPINEATYQKYHSPTTITHIMNQAFTTNKKPHGENK